MRKTKIICTIGPSSERKDVLRELILAGMNVARLNFSHGTHEEHEKRIIAIREVEKELKANVAVMLDTKGPEIRIGTFKNGKVYLKKGQKFSLKTYPCEGDETGVYVDLKQISEILKKGDRVLIADGLIELLVDEIKGEEIICTVNNEGELGSKKGVNLPGKIVPLPSVTEKDKEDIIFGIKMGVDFIAASFVRKAQDVIAIRKILEENGGQDIQIIAKIENQEGVNNIDEIIKVADAIMVARGDLGVEIPVEEVPIVQKKIIEKCNKAGRPVITATQMLDSMIRNPRPTRAETTDVANAILDGTDAIMLSGETAAGDFPVEAARMMAKIAEKVEETIKVDEVTSGRQRIIKTVTDAISHATYTIARDLCAAAIITSTKSGYTARMVAKFRPQAPIIAVTPKEKVLKTLQIVWGVYPIKINEVISTDEMFREAISGALSSGIIKKGDLVVITAGVPVNVTGTTNLIRVHIVGEVILKGTGIGNKFVTGIAFVADTLKKAMEMPDGAILVVDATDADYTPIIKRASAVITQEGGLTSHAAILGLEFGIPVVVGAEGATERIRTGEEITVDSQRGLIFRGRVDVK
ncbi:pyruvate kinase [Thermovenabulum gondwanense]|uniref:Pyruvate kinase n=1 Tax=Thermovenabulum gondwanense TaxID=520767 RepID=A0A161QDB5_9FIRM|nr:pyruvate kinase [Thermovenabulum gondwanense]KYO67833.1 Pyruvate kinase [Thermovenabulum gondwanense]